MEAYEIDLRNLPKDGASLQDLGCQYRDKFPRTRQDEEMAIVCWEKAAETGQLSGVPLADCYKWSGELLLEMKPKTDENYHNAIKLMRKSAEVSVPSWYDVHSLLEKALLHPEIYGYNRSLRDQTGLAAKCHEINKMVQPSGDIIITVARYMFDCMVCNEENVTEEDINIAQDYLEHAIKRGWNANLDAESYAMMARLFHYFKPKTTENFQKACEWYERCLSVDCKWSESSLGCSTSVAYMHYSDLLADPAAFGFDKALQDLKKAEELRQRGREYYSKKLFGYMEEIRRHIGWQKKIRKWGNFNPFWFGITQGITQNSLINS